MTTFTPVLKKKNTSDKTGIINIRLTKDRKSVYYSTKISLHQRFWNKKGKDIENKLRNQNDFEEESRLSIINDVNSLLSELKRNNQGAEDIQTLKTNEKTSFLNHLEGFIKHLEARKQIGTSKRYRTTLYHIKKHIKNISKSDLLFSDFTSLFIQDFESYLLDLGVKENTTKNYINCI